MQNTEDPTQYFEDIANEKEEEAAPQPKKGAPAKKGFFTNYTHFISIPLLGEDLKQKVLTFGVMTLFDYSESSYRKRYCLISKMSISPALDSNHLNYYT